MYIRNMKYRGIFTSAPFIGYFSQHMLQTLWTVENLVFRLFRFFYVLTISSSHISLANWSGSVLSQKCPNISGSGVYSTVASEWLSRVHSFLEFYFFHCLCPYLLLLSHVTVLVLLCVFMAATPVRFLFTLFCIGALCRPLGFLCMDKAGNDLWLLVPGTVNTNQLHLMWKTIT